MGGAEQFRVGPDEDPDRYRLERLHSSGAEGQVWRGSRELEGDVKLDVAVKILHAERQDLIAEWRDRWTEQVELLRSLQYPGVVPVREAFEGPFMHPVGQKGPKGRSLYLVMNWMEGESLHEWVSRRPGADVFEALRLLTQVADALDYMHSGRATGGKPVVHRDVKPANIIVSGDVAVLVDFGLVRALTKEAPPAPGIGTVSYMAPEVMTRGAYTPESDRYALGCVAYYMLTAEDPPADADAAVMRKKLAMVPALGANPSLLNHLMTMLDPDPAARPLRATSWVQLFRSSTLTEAGGKSGLPPIKPAQPSTIPIAADGAPAPRRRRTPAWLAVALVIALLGGAAAIYAAQRPTGEKELATGAPIAGVTSTTAPTSTSLTQTSTSSTSPPSTSVSTTTSRSTGTTYRYTTNELTSRLLSVPDILNSGFLRNAELTSADLTTRRVCASAALGVATSAISEPASSEFEGAGPYDQRKIGNELLQFRSVDAAEQFMTQVETAAKSCGMTVRLPGDIPTADRLLRLKDEKAVSGAFDRVFFRKGNIVGQVATELPLGSTTVAADELLKVLASHVP